MSELMHTQNSEVLQVLQDTFKIPPERLNEVSWIISKAHSEIARKTGDYLSVEFRRIESEIKETELLLIKKLAERRELMQLLKMMGREEGLQASIEIYLEKKDGEKNEKQSS